MCVFYNIAKFHILSGVMRPEADTFRVMLLTGTGPYVADPDHEYLSGSGAQFPVHSEMSGFGYTRTALSGSSVTYAHAGNHAMWDMVDAFWPWINAGTASAAVVFKDTGDEATSPLVFYLDTGGFPVETTGGDLWIQWSASGAAILT